MTTPMLAASLELGLEKHARQWERVQDYTMEPKLDGWRATVIRMGAGVRVFSRTDHELTAKLPVALLADLAGLPVGTILDGELGYVSRWVALEDLPKMWPIIDYNATARVLGSGEAVAQMKLAESTFDLMFHPFDMLQYSNEYLTDKPYAYRQMRLWEVLREHCAVTRELPSFPRWTEELYIEYVEAGGEGVMLKNPSGLYTPAKRPTQTWYKVKKFETIDVTITGAIDGLGKYTGQIGALCFRTPQGVEGKCSGMTDAERTLFTTMRDTNQLVGRKIEIRYFGNVGKSGEGIRHPQYVRMRSQEDK